MREVLRASLGRGLRNIPDEDKLAAAWTVACGKAMAGHGTVAGYDGSVVRVVVEDVVWLRQMMSLRNVLEQDMGRIAGLKVDRVEFELKAASRKDRS